MSNSNLKELIEKFERIKKLIGLKNYVKDLLL